MKSHGLRSCLSGLGGGGDKTIGMVVQTKTWQAVFSKWHGRQHLSRVQRCLGFEWVEQGQCALVCFVLRKPRCCGSASP